MSCRWKLSGGGSEARPVLAADTAVYIDADGVRFGTVTVYYGTSQFPDGVDLTSQIVVEGDEISRCGLNLRTRFNIDARSRQELIWSFEHFAAPRYSPRVDPYVGTISDEALARLDQLAPRSDDS